MSAAHEPNPKQREAVEMLVASGIQHKHIAGILGISEPTLRAHYADELALGKAKKLAAVAATVFQAAIGRPARFDDRGNKVQAELKPNVASAFFILKCQGGWKETNVVEIIDPTAGARERLAGLVDRSLAALEPDAGAAPEDAPPMDRGRIN